MPLYASFPPGTAGVTPPTPPPSSDMTFTSGSVWTASGSTQISLTLPTAPTLEVGDRILLFGVSRHQTAALKSMTVPSGYSSHGSSLAADYIPDVHCCSKKAVSDDLGAVVTFGTYTRRIDWAIIKNWEKTGYAIWPGTGASGFSSPRAVPNIAGGAGDVGTHFVSVTVSGETGDSTVVAAGYSSSYSITAGYHHGRLFAKDPATLPTGTPEFGGTVSSGSPSVNVMSIFFREGT